MNQQSILGRFVGFVESYPSSKYRVAKVIEIDKKKRFPIGERKYKTKPAVKVQFHVVKSRKVERKDGTEYIKRYREQTLIPLDTVVSVFLRRGNNRTRKEIPIDTWNEQHPEEGP